MVGWLGQGHVAQHTQHSAADVAQVGGPLCQQPVGQHLLSTGGGVDGFPPASLRRAPFADGVQRRLTQLGVVQHLFVHGEDVGHFTARCVMHQRLQLGGTFLQRCTQAARFCLGVAGVLGIVERQRTNDEHRCNGQPRRRRHAGMRGIGRQRRDIGLAGISGGAGLAAAIEGRDFLAQALFHGGGEGFQGAVGLFAFSGKNQPLAAACAKADDLGQTGRRDGGGAALFQPNVDGHGLGAGDLHQLFGRAGVQAVGVENAHTACLRLGGFSRQQRQQLGTALAHQAFTLATLHQCQQLFEQRAVAVAAGRQAEEGVNGAPVVFDGISGRGHAQRGLAYPRCLAGEPEAFAQPLWRSAGHGADESIVDAAALAQPGRGGQCQLLRVSGREVDTQGVGVQPGSHGGAGKQPGHAGG